MVWRLDKNLQSAVRTIQPTGDRPASRCRMDWIQHVQWPAMAVTVLSAWFVGSQQKDRRNWGFWLFLTSNALWIVWGWHDHAYALIVLQVALAIINVRGVKKNETA